MPIALQMTVSWSWGEGRREYLGMIRASTMKSRIEWRGNSKRLSMSLPFASKLERNRGKLLGCSTHDNLADSSTAGEEDVIELVLKQQGGFIYGTVDDPVGTLIQVRGEQPCQQHGRVRCHLGGFQYHRVSGSDRADRGGQQQVQWIVPSTDNQDEPQRVLSDMNVIKLVDDAGLDRAVGRPLVQVLDRIDTLLFEYTRLAYHKLLRMLIQILVNGLPDGGIVLGQQVVESSELLLAILEGLCDTGTEG